MPRYNYQCVHCDIVEEQTHSIKVDPKFHCPECKKLMQRMIGMGIYVSTGFQPSLEDRKEAEHTKKVKDPERAVRSRQKLLGRDAAGDPSMTTDPRHIVRRGRTLGGQEKDIDKREFIQAAAKDDYILEQCIKATKNK